MAQFNAHFRNINGDDTYPLTDVIYRSKVDGSLLEVAKWCFPTCPSKTS